MDITKYMAIEGEKPLDNIPANGGFSGIFRTIACIGDSLSSGEFESMTDGKKGYHDYYEYSWGQYIARDIGALVYNFSKGGMDVRTYCDSFARERGFWDRDKAAQAYIIALGVNDISRMLEGKMEFGDISDVHPEDHEKNGKTFAGYYGKIISKYKEIQPKARFFLMTLPSHHQKDERGEYHDRHQKLMYQLCELFEFCYVLDFRAYAPDYNDEFKRNFYLGGHLSAAGYLLTARMVEAYIDYLIRHNPDDFRQVGFIGKAYHNETARW